MAATKLPGPSQHSLPNRKIIPTFKDKSKERAWAKGEMAAAFRIFAKLGYADGLAGHMSLRDPINPDLFWINPYAVHFSLMKVSDLVLVNEEGEIQEPTPHTVSHSGLVIHSTIHKMRPDLNVACHVHSPHGTAWSAFGKPVEMLLQDMCYFYDDLSVYEGFGGSVLAKEEGMNIAKALGPKNKNLILQNHGIMSCGSTVGEAVGLFIALDRACQRQLLIEAAAANGVPKCYVPEAEAAYSKKYDYAPEDAYMSWKPEYDCILEETKGAFLE